MSVTKTGKPTAWFVAQLVEEPNGDVLMWLTRSGPTRGEAESKAIDVGPITFKRTTGQSGDQAHSKLATLIHREQP